MIETTIQQPKILERMANAGKPTKATRAKKAKEQRMIDLLVSMDTRRKAAHGAGDREALLELAAEYLTLGYGCPDTCSQITLEAENL